MGGAAWGGYDLALKEEDKALLGILDASWDSSSPSVMQSFKDCDPNSSPEAACADDQSFTGLIHPPPATTTGRRKRRRTKSSRNKEDVENQRMTHIAVERNRRKQMNEYLAVLRSLMPPSYVQRGDQASIIGGAINFVKELEQLLQFMEGDKTTKQETESWVSSNSPLAQFFIFPQYSTRAAENESTAAAAADIEVTMVESHANLKILSRKQPGQLLKMVAAFQTLRLTILHLNVTTVDQMVLYSVSVKVEEGSQLNTVDEIAAAVNQMLRRMQEEAAFT
ncbi:transcription factor bHLH96-like isoform X2 [Corylus avellana]|nr:transcription factor bHLH96-like isoform X2 [Corylus avellana]